MLDNFFIVATNSGIQVAFQLGIALIATALVSFTAIRIWMSLVATSTEKARKQWVVQPAEGAQPSHIARLLGNYEEQPASQALLSDEVQHMLLNCSSPKPKAGSN